eukprot:3280475-Rhodomonas_salina.5
MHCVSTGDRTVSGLQYRASQHTVSVCRIQYISTGDRAVITVVRNIQYQDAAYSRSVPGTAHRSSDLRAEPAAALLLYRAPPPEISSTMHALSGQVPNHTRDVGTMLPSASSK